MDEVTICEMSPRDGLQFYGGLDPTASRTITVERKIELIRTLEGAGLKYIEVGSFVRPTSAPQMDNTDKVADRLKLVRRVNGVRFAALVPNMKGYQRFRNSGLDIVALFPSASEQHSKENFGAPIDEVLARAEEVAQAAQSDNKVLRAHVSSAFQAIHSGYQKSDIANVIRICHRLFSMGCEYLTLADTNGDTHPYRVREVLKAVGDEFGGFERIGIHLHDRNGTGLSNAFAAYEAGVRIFDASVGGIGGSVAASKLRTCTKGNIAGNIATEQLVMMFEKMKVRTNINLDAILRAGEIVYEITRLTGDFAPPSMLLREHLGYGIAWTPEPPMPIEEVDTKKTAA